MCRCDGEEGKAGIHILPFPSPSPPSSSRGGTPTPGSPLSEAHCGTLNREQPWGGCSLPFRVRSEHRGDRGRQGARAGPGGLGSCTRVGDTQTKARARGAARSPCLAGTQGLPKGALPCGASDPRISHRFRTAGTERNGGALLCPHWEPLCHLFPL